MHDVTVDRRRSVEVGSAARCRSASASTAVGVGALTPVVDELGGLSEAQLGALGDQGRFVIGEHCVTPGPVRPPEQFDVIQRQLAGRDRRRRWRASFATAAPGAAPRWPMRQRGASVAGQPGRGAPRPVAGPHAAIVPAGQQSARRAEPGPLPLHDDDRVVQLAVGERVGVELEDCVDVLVESIHKLVHTFTLANTRSDWQGQRRLFLRDARDVSLCPACDRFTDNGEGVHVPRVQRPTGRSWPRPPTRSPIVRSP